MRAASSRPCSPSVHRPRTPPSVSARHRSDEHRAGTAAGNADRGIGRGFALRPRPGVAGAAADVKAEEIKATLADGILTVTVPTAQAAKPRHIEITGV
ncbi:Hsp20 family protein [Streptomyces sp. NPDC007095]|uniref:Hsp20/alpha crystallin family protein n=1 Tax=Streptomyces sp. NPDC007095 TaxID=3154482 RepID=UPI0033FC51D0